MALLHNAARRGAAWRVAADHSIMDYYWPPELHALAAVAKSDDHRMYVGSEQIKQCREKVVSSAHEALLAAQDILTFNAIITGLRRNLGSCELVHRTLTLVNKKTARCAPDYISAAAMWSPYLLSMEELGVAGLNAGFREGFREGLIDGFALFRESSPTIAMELWRSAVTKVVAQMLRREAIVRRRWVGNVLAALSQPDDD